MYSCSRSQLKDVCCSKRVFQEYSKTEDEKAQPCMCVCVLLRLQEGYRVCVHSQSLWTSSSQAHISACNKNSIATCQANNEGLLEKHQVKQGSFSSMSPELVFDTLVSYVNGHN